MNSHCKQAIKKYYIFCIILGVILISLWVLYSLRTNSLIGMILLLLADLIIIKVSVVIIAKKTLLPVLYDDLNAIEFQKIVNNKHFVAPLIFRANAAVASGDYQTAINIASKQIVNSDSNLNCKYYYLSLLARIYFELRDFEKLNLLLKKYDELKALNPSKKIFNTSNSIWDFFRDFLNSDFETCKLICKNIEKTLQTKANNKNSRYAALINKFYYAVVCYSDGTIETALQIFKDIIHTAPQMHLADVSQKYVESIDTSSEMPVLEELIPQKDYQLYDDETKEKLHRHKVFSVILLIIICVSVVIVSVLNFENKQQRRHESEYNSSIAEFEKDLNNAIERSYDNANFVKYFNVVYREQHIDTFCLIERNGSLDLASIVTYDGGESLNLVLLIENIQIPYDYSVKSAVSDYKIAFYITDEQIPTSNGTKIVEFSLNNKSYWIEIKSVTPLN